MKLIFFVYREDIFPKKLTHTSDIRRNQKNLEYRGRESVRRGYRTENNKIGTVEITGIQNMSCINPSENKQKNFSNYCKQNKF